MTLQQSSTLTIIGLLRFGSSTVASVTVTSFYSRPLSLDSGTDEQKQLIKNHFKHKKYKITMSSS